MKKKHILALAALLTILVSFIPQSKPVFYIIGDSTVRNPNPPQCSWGQLIGNYFDTTRLEISNQAMAGRSTRTFLREGRWEKVISAIKPGDFLIMQFGHNEGGQKNPDARGVLAGIGADTLMQTLPTGIEVVHTYGWYLRKFASEAKAKGAVVMIASMIPRNIFKDDKVVRANQDFGLWAQQIATETGARFIDLNSITADKFEKMGPDMVKNFFPFDHTHTNIEGAAINAGSVVLGIRMDKTNPLNAYFAVYKK